MNLEEARKRLKQEIEKRKNRVNKTRKTLERAEQMSLIYFEEDGTQRRVPLDRGVKKSVQMNTSNQTNKALRCPNCNSPLEYTVGIYEEDVCEAVECPNGCNLREHYDDKYEENN